MLRIWTSTSIWIRLSILTALAAIVVPVAWYLGSPLFINRMVNEPFPIAAPTRNEPANVISDPPAKTATDVPEPLALSSGHFGIIDSIHRGEGTATLFKLPDGRHVLRFEQFKVTNGPDLYVYLSGSAAPTDSRQLHEGAVFEVAPLKGNIGGQNYELPADLDLAQFKSVVIYCKRFSVVFSTAELIADG